MRKPFKTKSRPRAADPTAKEEILEEWVRMAMVDKTTAVCKRTSPNSKKRDPFD
jgi:hypothetical protein